MSERLDLLEEHAREIVRAPPGWVAYRYHNLDGGLIRIDGAVAPIKTRGKYAGLPDWRKRDRDTKRSAYFSPAEHDAWCEAWQAKTGKCWRCVGTGSRMVGWSRDVGFRTAACTTCNGTGAP